MLPGIVGVIQANEALKILVGYGDPLIGRLLMFDAQPTTFRELKLRRDPKCATCGADASAWKAFLGEDTSLAAPAELVAAEPSNGASPTAGGASNGAAAEASNGAAAAANGGGAGAGVAIKAPGKGGSSQARSSF